MKKINWRRLGWGFFRTKEMHLAVRALWYYSSQISEEIFKTNHDNCIKFFKVTNYRDSPLFHKSQMLSLR